MSLYWLLIGLLLLNNEFQLANPFLLKRLCPSRNIVFTRASHGTNIIQHSISRRLSLHIASSWAFLFPCVLSSVAVSTSGDTAITHRVILHIRISATRAAQGKRDDIPAEEGTLTFGLYGNAAPATVKSFLAFCEPDEIDTRPLITKAQLFRRDPEVAIEAGIVQRPNEVSVGGSTFTYYDLSSFKVTQENEKNNLLHDRRGLLSRRFDSSGPSFDIALAPAPSLDKTSVVFGELLSGLEFLDHIESVPIYTQSINDKSGSVADFVFNAQKKVDICPYYCLLFTQNCI